MLKSIFSGIALCLSLVSYSQLIHDESYRDLGFHHFKMELEEAILNQDTSKLRPLLADTIFESDDACGYTGCTRNDFLKSYFGREAEYSWRYMRHIVQFGFSKSIDVSPSRIVKHDSVIFVGPSYLAKVNTDKEVILLGEKVEIREKPAKESRVIRNASYEKFKCDCIASTMSESTLQYNEGVDWLELYLADGSKGYVIAMFTSYNFIKEMTVARVKGKWQIISFYNPPGK